MHVAVTLTDGLGILETGTQCVSYGLILKIWIWPKTSTVSKKLLNFGSGDNYLDTRRYRHQDYPGRISVDLAVKQAAEEVLNKRGVREQFQTWLPTQPRKGVLRFKFGEVKKLAGSPRARRLKLVQNVDAIVTIEGVVHTALVLEAAIAAGCAALPIGFTGGDSADFWRDEQSTFVRRLRLSRSLRRKIGTVPRKQDEKGFAEEIAAAVVEQTTRKCLILMGFSKKRMPFYENVIRKAVVQSGYLPIRLDEKELAGHITTKFLENLRNCNEVIVDVTVLNANVMYELGHVHHYRGPEPLIVTCKDRRRLPFYLREHNLIEVGRSEAKARTLIIRHLRSRRRADPKDNESRLV